MAGLKVDAQNHRLARRRPLLQPRRHLPRLPRIDAAGEPGKPLFAPRPPLWQNGAMTAEHELQLLGRIVGEPGKMGGKPIIRGRRITPAMVLNMFANGATRQEILAAYPVL